MEAWSWMSFKTKNRFDYSSITNVCMCVPVSCGMPLLKVCTADISLWGFPGQNLPSPLACDTFWAKVPAAPALWMDWMAAVFARPTQTKPVTSDLLGFNVRMKITGIRNVQTSTIKPSLRAHGVSVKTCETEWV